MLSVSFLQWLSDRYQQVQTQTGTHTRDAPTHKHTHTHTTDLRCHNPWPCADIPGGPVCARDIQLSAPSDLMCHLFGAICQTHVSPQAAAFNERRRSQRCLSTCPPTNRGEVENYAVKKLFLRQRCKIMFDLFSAPIFSCRIIFW